MNTKIKKIIPYFLTLIILVGIFVFVPTKQAKADNPGDKGTCVLNWSYKSCTAKNGASTLPPTSPDNINGQCTMSGWTRSSCTSNSAPAAPNFTLTQSLVTGCVNQSDVLDPTITSSPNCVSPNVWGPTYTDPGTAAALASNTPPPSGQTGNQAIDGYLQKNTCNNLSNFSFSGCMVLASYYLFIPIPALLLTGTAYFFNFLASITLYSNIYSGSTFIPTAWGVVRDLSNIFFILILLYISIRLILGIDSHGVKQMIGKVVIIALLINFSMFFTEVIIDSSNILALIFYNKMSVSTTVNGASTPYQSANGEKDIAGGMTAAFNPLSLLKPDFFSPITVPGQPPIPGQTASPSTIMGILIIAGALMCFAAYAFFIAGLSFVGRMIELFILIIFSPFAFMSSTVPLLNGIEDIGWKSWSHKLITSSFMAPIFMFFMYFIFLLIHANMFNTLLSNTNPGFMVNLLYVLIPAIFILVLLLKATKYAKKGSGAFGEYVMKGASMVGGLALGAATGGASVVGTATLGRAGSALANSEWAKTHGAVGRGLQNVGKFAGSSNFDIRGVKIGGKTLASATGMNLGEAKKGGFTERRKEDVEKRRKRADELKVGEDEELTQTLHTHENALQDLRAEGSHEIEEIDKRIEGAIKADKAAQSALNAARGTPAEAAARAVALTASNRVNDLRGQRGAIKNATGDQANMTDLNTNLTNRQNFLQLAQQAGNPRDIAQAEADLHSAQVALNVAAVAAQNGNRSMNNYEDTIIPEAHHAIENESRRRKRIYADSVEGGASRVKNFILSGGQSSHKGSVEAAHKIRMEAKIEEKGSGH